VSYPVRDLIYRKLVCQRVVLLPQEITNALQDDVLSTHTDELLGVS